MNVLDQLLTPLRYLRMRNEPKEVIDSVVPVVLGLSTLLLVANMSAPPLLGSNGLVGMVNQLFQVLVGFYVASLAAVATFNTLSMEQNVKHVELDGKPIKRRQFLCYLFGHLSAISFVLYIGGIIASMAADGLHRVAEAAPWFRWVCIAAYAAIFWHIFSVTMLGLHYLIDRGQREDPVATPKPVQSAKGTTLKPRRMSRNRRAAV